MAPTSKPSSSAPSSSRNTRPRSPSPPSRNSRLKLGSPSSSPPPPLSPPSSPPPSPPPPPSSPPPQPPPRPLSPPPSSPLPPPRSPLAPPTFKRNRHKPLTNEEIALRVQAFQLLETPDFSSLQNLIAHLTKLPKDPQNPEQIEANTLFTFCTSKYPNALSLKLSNYILSDTSFNFRNETCTLLHNLLTQTPFESLSRIILADLKVSIFSSFKREKQIPTAMILREILCCVASRVYVAPGGNWDELRDYVISSINSESEHRQEVGLSMFREIPQIVGSSLTPIPDSLQMRLLELFTSLSSHIQFLALSATFSFACKLDEYEGHADMSNLLLGMINLINDNWLAGGQKELVEKGLEGLSNLARKSPDFLFIEKDFVLETMIRIAESDSGSDIRCAAIDVLIGLDDAAMDQMLEMMKTMSSEMIRRIISILMDMIACFEDDPVWYNMETDQEDNNSGLSKSYYTGVCLLDRISFNGKENIVVSIAFKLMSEYLASDNWKKRYSGVKTLDVIEDSCPQEVTVDYFDQAVTMISTSLRDPHPRVRCFATNFIIQRNAEFRAKLAVYNLKILPPLVAIIDDFQNPFLQERAVAAIRTFIESCPTDNLTPYISYIERKFIVLLQNENQKLVEEVMEAQKLIAKYFSEQFHPIYNDTMESLKAVLCTDSDASRCLIRVKSAECMCSIHKDLNKGKFGTDVTEVIITLISLQGSLIDTDHPIRISIFQVLAQLCRFLEKDSVTFLKDFVPKLLQSAELSIDADAGESTNYSVSTEKAFACKMLSHCAARLKEKFAPWVHEVSEVLVPLLEFHLHFGTRKASALAMPKLLLSALSAVKEENGYDMSYMQELALRIIPALLQALYEESDKKTCHALLRSLRECIEIPEIHITDAQIKLIIDKIKHLTEGFLNKLDIGTSQGAAYFEKGQNEKLRRKILHQIFTCLKTMIRKFKTRFVPYFDSLECLNRLDNLAEEREMGISIFNYFVQQCKEAANRYYDIYMPILMQACTDDSPYVRKEAAKGISLCAVVGRSKFEAIADGSVPLLLEATPRISFSHIRSSFIRNYHGLYVVAAGCLECVIKHPNATSSEGAMAHDAAVSALGKIMEYQYDNINAYEVVQTWLNCLPLKNDWSEAKIAHAQLANMLQWIDGDLLGPENEHLPKVLSVIKQVLAEKHKLATEATAILMEELLSQYEF